MNSSIVILTIVGIILLWILWSILRKSHYEPFIVSDLNTLINQNIVPNNLTGTTYTSLYKKTAQNEPNLDTFWKTVSDSKAQLLFDDRREFLQMISCISKPANTNYNAFFKTVDFYTEYFETNDTNITNVKKEVIYSRIKALYDKNNQKIHGPAIIMIWQSPNYIMEDGTIAITNGNIGDLDYKYQARYPLDNNDPIHFSMYLIVPLHKPDGTPDFKRRKEDICSRLGWLKKEASKDNSCFIKLPGDTNGSFGGCQNLYLNETWHCVNSPNLDGIYRRNAANNFECITLDNTTCKKIRATQDCKKTLDTVSNSILVTDETITQQLNQLFPVSDYQSTCMGPGSGETTDRKRMNYGIAYFVNPDFTDVNGLFDELAIYPFDESQLGKCPKVQASLNVMDILKRDGQLLVDSEIDIVSIRSPTIPKDLNFKNDVMYTISYWIRLDTYYPSWRNIFIHGNDDGDRSPAMYVHPSNGRLHAGQASTRSWNEIVNSKTIMDLNQWYHVLLVTNVNTMSLYVNGALEDKLTLPGNAKFKWTARSTPINRMTYAALPNNRFTPKNRIKQFRWFNRVLTQTEIDNVRYLS
jgi:hypothetical protein